MEELYIQNQLKHFFGCKISIYFSNIEISIWKDKLRKIHQPIHKNCSLPLNFIALVNFLKIVLNNQNCEVYKLNLQYIQKSA